jgi:DNA-binding NtrC family response regulator
MSIDLLICDDQPYLRGAIDRFVKNYFPDKQVQITACNGVPTLRKLLETGQLKCDIAITDINFSEAGGGAEDGLEILHMLKEWKDVVEVMLVTKYTYEDRKVVEAHRNGMADWIRLEHDKEEEIVTHCLHCQQPQEENPAGLEFPSCTLCGAPLKLPWYEMRLTLQHLFEKVDLRKQLDSARRGQVYYRKMWETVALEAPQGALRRTAFGKLIGTSEVMKQIYDTAARIAPLSAPVLITGQTGTGKDLLARAIHAHSARKDKRFEPIECTNVQDNVLESELFGVIANYPGFHNREPLPGKIESAEGGTVFLNEIGDMPLWAQTKLLGFLDSYEPGVGYTIMRMGERESRHIDVRIIAATNADLRKLVAEGRFREDLYYRIDLLHIPLPPLKERKDDIPLLLRHFLRLKSGQLGCKPGVLSDDAVKALCEYQWPGNVRELEHFVERLLVSCPVSPVSSDNEVIRSLIEGVSEVHGDDADAIWQSILNGKLSETLGELREQFGRPMTISIARKAVAHFHGHWPPDPGCGELFGGMSSDNFRQRLFKWGYTLKDLK